MNISKAEYLISVANSKDLLNDNVPEFAFVGRSNVGKSSLLNYLTGKKELAKTSSTPGKTRLVNYFDVNDFRLVDLPGYGFARVGKSQKDVWSSLIGDYLLSSKSLVLTFLLLDCRHLPSEQDKQMIQYMMHYNLPFMVIVTKIDKLSKQALNLNIKKIAAALKLREEMFVAVSSQAKLGREKLLNIIETRLSLFENKE